MDWQDLNFGDFDENKNQLRPHIVWFGEEVPALDEAIRHLLKVRLFCGNRDLLTSILRLDLLISSKHLFFILIQSL
jgi:hypothetical protein